MVSTILKLIKYPKIRCGHCQYEWVARQLTRPVRCPSCKNPLRWRREN